MRGELSASAKQAELSRSEPDYSAWQYRKFLFFGQDFRAN
jgi:hypothetical protein